MNTNVKAFLDTIAVSEGTAYIGDNGYNVIVGSTKEKPNLFTSYKDHPRKIVAIPKWGIKSSAAGRYQLLMRYFDAYKKMLNLPDFSPASQDAIAIQQIAECKALEDIKKGNFDEAVHKCKRIWASFPGAGYNQNEHSIDYLRKVFISAGGKINKAN